MIEQLRRFQLSLTTKNSPTESSLLFTFATLLDLSDLQSAVRPAGVHDFRPPTLLYRGDQSFHRLYVHVFGTDLQRGAREPISNTFPDTGSLRFREIHTIQTEPRQVLQMGQDRLHEYVFHLHLLRAVGHDQSIRL